MRGHRTFESLNQVGPVVERLLREGVPKRAIQRQTGMDRDTITRIDRQGWTPYRRSEGRKYYRKELKRCKCGEMYWYGGEVAYCKPVELCVPCQRRRER